MRKHELHPRTIQIPIKSTLHLHLDVQTKNPPSHRTNDHHHQIM